MIYKIITAYTFSLKSSIKPLQKPVLSKWYDTLCAFNFLKSQLMFETDTNSYNRQRSQHVKQYINKSYIVTNKDWYKQNYSTLKDCYFSKNLLTGTLNELIIQVLNEECFVFILLNQNLLSKVYALDFWRNPADHFEFSDFLRELHDQYNTNKSPHETSCSWKFRNIFFV